MLFSSQEGFLTKGLYFSSLDYDLFVTPLIPIRNREEYIAKNQIQLRQLRNTHKTDVSPIFLKTPNSRYKNILNPSILGKDFVSIFTILNRIRPDVIICFYMLDAYPLVMLRKLFNYSLCVIATGGDINLKRGLIHRMVRKFIYLGCDLVFATSEELKDKIQTEHDIDVMVIPTGTDPSFFKPISSNEYFREKWAIGQEDVVILTVCRLVKTKGVDAIIKALAYLKRRLQSDAKLVIAGDGPERIALEELATKLGVQQNVIFLSFIGRSELLELYNLADIFVLASYSEGVPRALLEAMACKCISISTNVGDVPRIILNGFNGFLVKKGDPVNLAEKINEALSLPKDEKSLIKDRARCTVMNGFDQRKLSKKMIDILISKLC